VEGRLFEADRVAAPSDAGERMTYGRLGVPLFTSSMPFEFVVGHFYAHKGAKFLFFNSPLVTIFSDIFSIILIHVT
jgi:hypothetical protein